MFFSKLQRTDNIVLRTLVCVPMVKHEMVVVGSKYGWLVWRWHCLLLLILYDHVL